MTKAYTLLELMVVLAVTALLVGALALFIPLMLTQPPKQGNKLAVEENLQFARYWLNQDGNMAQTFVPRSSPTYGYFQWSDYTAESLVTNKAYYYYDSGLLMRQLKKDDIVDSTFSVARGILQESNIAFNWYPATARVVVDITSTIEDAPAVGTATRTTSVTVALRPELEPTVSPPGEEPIPPPPTGL